MADKLTQNKQQHFLTRCNQGIDAAPSQVAQLKQGLLDVNANWAGYAAIEDDTDELQAAGIAFGTRVATTWTTAKPNLEAALDVLAGGMGVTRNSLLESMQTE